MPMRLNIFVVDDDPDYGELLRYHLKRHADVAIRLFTTGEEAVAHLDEEPDLVLCDVVMPGQGGLETLRRIKAQRPELPVVMVSAQAAVSVALEAMKLGAYDYVTKGHDDTVKLQSIVAHVAERLRLTRELATLRDQLPAMRGLRGIIGESAAMARVFRLVQKALRGDLTVAIQGESGTGKELVAEAIHYNSKRRRQPFVVVNCAAIPRELMESEFFGHEKGSFTGAHARKAGKFEQADGGTIFLDEIGELDLGLQAKLLRVLQNQEVQRVGGAETIKVDVRILSATNRNVAEMIREGRFREDLYYRLFQFPIKLPPLRERDQDALLLADHFRKAFLAKHPDVEPRPFSAATRRYILRYPWPGNVRELKNAVERALLISDFPEITPADLMLEEIAPFAVKEVSEPLPEPPAAPGSNHPAEQISRVAVPDEIIPLETLKVMAVVHAYEVCGGNINKAAARLGITRSTVYRLLKKREEPSA